MPVVCIFPGCSSRSNRDKVRFYSVPTALNLRFLTDRNELSKKRRALWLAAINRNDLTATKIKNQRVCSKHFISGKPAPLLDPDNADWVPTQKTMRTMIPLSVLQQLNPKGKSVIIRIKKIANSEPETSRRPPLDTEFVQCEDYEEQQDERQKVLEEITIKIEPEEETEVKLEDRPPEPTYFKCHPDREAGIVVCLICDSVYHRSEYNEENRHRLGYVTGNLIVCPDHEDLVNDCEDVKVVLAKTGEKLKESEKKYHDLVKVFKKLKEKLDDGGDENVEEVRVAAGKRRRRR